MNEIKIQQLKNNKGKTILNHLFITKNNQILKIIKIKDAYGNIILR